MTRFVGAFALLVACALPPKGAATSTSSPAHSYLELDQPKQPPPRDVELLDARDATTDIELLMYVLERGYVGRPFVPDTSWKEMMQRLTRLKGNPTSVRDLCDGVGDALWQLPDAHLAARRRTPKEKTSKQCGAL